MGIFPTHKEHADFESSVRSRGFFGGVYGSTNIVEKQKKQS